MQSQRRRKLLAANWKMHGDRAAVEAWCAELLPRAAALAGAPTSANTKLAMDVVLCPPAILIPYAVAAAADSPVAVGAQDVAATDNGAYTGQISARMLVAAGCDFVIVGHSERRAMQCEGDTQVARKAKIALAAGLNTIVCVGETAAQRDAGDAKNIVACQVGVTLDLAPKNAMAKLVFAYEPVWAIGGGVSATPTQAQAMHALIRGLIAKRDARAASACRIIYGGSMNAKNAAALLAEPDIDGGLLGGAGLVAADFYAVWQAAARA